MLLVKDLPALKVLLVPLAHPAPLALQARLARLATVARLALLVPLDLPALPAHGARKVLWPQELTQE